MVRLMLFAALLGLATCGETPPEGSPAVGTVAPGETFELAAGESVRIVDETGEQEEGVLLFEAVAEDSRCPAGVDCVWAGEAHAQFELFYADDTVHSFTLVMPGLRREGVDREEADRATVAGYEFALLRLDPYPQGDAELEQPATATLTFIRLIK